MFSFQPSPFFVLDEVDGALGAFPSTKLYRPSMLTKTLRRQHQRRPCRPLRTSPLGEERLPVRSPLFSLQLEWYSPLLPPLFLAGASSSPTSSSCSSRLPRSSVSTAKVDRRPSPSTSLSTIRAFKPPSFLSLPLPRLSITCRTSVCSLNQLLRRTVAEDARKRREKQKEENGRRALPLLWLARLATGARGSEPCRLSFRL